MNIGGSFFGSFPTAGALSRTVLQDATGGNTQVSLYNICLVYLQRVIFISLLVLFLHLLYFWLF